MNSPEQPREYSSAEVPDPRLEVLRELKGSNPEAASAGPLQFKDIKLPLTHRKAIDKIINKCAEKQAEVRKKFKGHLPEKHRLEIIADSKKRVLEVLAKAKVKELPPDLDARLDLTIAEAEAKKVAAVTSEPVSASPRDSFSSDDPATMRELRELLSDRKKAVIPEETNLPSEAVPNPEAIALADKMFGDLGKGEDAPPARTPKQEAQPERPTVESLRIPEKVKKEIKDVISHNRAVRGRMVWQFGEPEHMDSQTRTRYDRTRDNAGFTVLDLLRKALPKQRVFQIPQEYYDALQGYDAPQGPRPETAEERRKRVTEEKTQPARGEPSVATPAVSPRPAFLDIIAGMKQPAKEGEPKYEVAERTQDKKKRYPMKRLDSLAQAKNPEELARLYMKYVDELERGRANWKDLSDVDEQAAQARRELDAYYKERLAALGGGAAAPEMPSIELNVGKSVITSREATAKSAQSEQAPAAQEKEKAKKEKKSKTTSESKKPAEELSPPQLEARQLIGPLAKEMVGLSGIFEMGIKFERAKIQGQITEYLDKLARENPEQIKALADNLKTYHQREAQTAQYENELNALRAQHGPIETLKEKEALLQFARGGWFEKFISGFEEGASKPNTSLARAALEGIKGAFGRVSERIGARRILESQYGVKIAEIEAHQEQLVPLIKDMEMKESMIKTLHGEYEALRKGILSDFQPVQIIFKDIKKQAGEKLSGIAKKTNLKELQKTQEYLDKLKTSSAYGAHNYLEGQNTDKIQEELNIWTAATINTELDKAINNIRPSSKSGFETIVKLLKPFTEGGQTLGSKDSERTKQFLSNILDRKIKNDPMSEEKRQLLYGLFSAAHLPPAQYNFSVSAEKKES